MSKTQDYVDFTKQVKAKLDQGVGPPLPTNVAEPDSSSKLRKLDDEWVKLLYTKYTERFINDNNKIWTIGTILIPLCLAGLLSVKDLNIYSTFLLGVGSVILMRFWVLVAENHRAFQNRSQAVVEEIERYVGFDINWGPKLDSHDSVKSPSRNVQSVRWRMYYAVIIIWSFAVVGKVVEAVIEPYAFSVLPPKISLKKEMPKKISIEFSDSSKAIIQKR